MRIAVITDVHANLPALEAALRQIDRAGCDQIVHTGDAIGIGPFPAEVLATLLDRADLTCLMGNHDAWFAFGLPDPQPEWMSDAELAHQQWTHAQLSPSQREAVRTWAFTSEMTVDEWQIAFVHYALNADGMDFQPILRDATAADLAHLFGDTSVDILFHGHHHPQSDLQTERTRYVNPGALGCNVGTPVARWALLDVGAHGKHTLTLHAAAYDDRLLFQTFAQRDVPARFEIYEFFFRRSQPLGSAA